MTENNQLEKQEIKRPWQGSVLGFFVVSRMIFLLYVIFGTIKGLWVETVIVLLFELPILFLHGLIVVGVFKRIKGLMIFNVIYLIFLILIDLLISFGMFMSISGIDILFAVFILKLVIDGFCLYLQIFCLKHPFYNQKKLEQKD